MNKLLLFSAVFFASCAGYAQESNDLFPELTQKQEVPVVQQQQEVIVETFEASENEKTKNMSGNFEIRPHNLKIIVPPVQKMQFCSVSLTLKNDSQYNLNGVNIMFDFNGTQVPFRFAKANSGDETTGSMSLAGEVCQSLITEPKMDIVLCSANGISESDCKNRVKYILE